ncbi:PEGA domain-containing protein [Bremerella cremea]|uniref:PEGA domain-containing protein n=1 Tax=Bremerella cremea TaxID=1031537 RepID=A0A368KUB0_9BACT|nr:PEGA domain-containing protein [Bremerella cremea]RCS50284.1 PEGA domain-containing protein [Bremerella cremea]
MLLFYKRGLLFSLGLILFFVISNNLVMAQKDSEFRIYNSEEFSKTIYPNAWKVAFGPAITKTESELAIRHLNDLSSPEAREIANTYLDALTEGESLSNDIRKNLQMAAGSDKPVTDINSGPLELEFGIIQSEHWMNEIGTVSKSSMDTNVLNKTTLKTIGGLKVLTRSSIQHAGGDPEPEKQFVIFASISIARTWSRIDIRSTPSGAMIEAGPLKGETRIRKFLKPGTYEVKISKPGYESQTQDIELVGGDSHTLLFTLVKESTSGNIKPNLQD